MTVEFDCCECGVAVISYAEDKPPEPPICCTCLMMPGWFNDPVLRGYLGKGRQWPHDYPNLQR